MSVLGDVRYPDMVAEVADFLLRLDQVTWAVAIGTFGSCLHCSIRTTERDVNAGDLLQQVLGSKLAGGHDMIAGGWIHVGPDPAAHERAAVMVRDRLLTAVGLDPSGAGSRWWRSDLPHPPFLVGRALKVKSHARHRRHEAEVPQDVKRSMVQHFQP